MAGFGHFNEKIMPFPCTMHACGYCGTPYLEYGVAVECEQLGPAIGTRMPAGTNVVFEDENTMFGSRYSYTTNSGIVLYSYTVRSQDIHIWAHVVEITGARFAGAEGILLAGQQGYVCSAEHKYGEGFAARLRSLHMNQHLLYPIHY